MLKEIKSSNKFPKETHGFLTPDKKKTNLSINDLCKNNSFKIKKKVINDSSDVSVMSKVLLFF